MPYASGPTFIFDYGGTTTGKRITTTHTPTLNYEKWVFRAGPMGLSMWLDGIKLSEYTGGAASRSPSIGNFFLYGRLSTANTTRPSDLYQLVIADREWSDAEIVSWSKDPYQFLIPA